MVAVLFGEKTIYQDSESIRVFIPPVFHAGESDQPPPITSSAIYDLNIFTATYRVYLQPKLVPEPMRYQLEVKARDMVKGMVGPRGIIKTFNVDDDCFVVEGKLRFAVNNPSVDNYLRELESAAQKYVEERDRSRTLCNDLAASVARLVVLQERLRKHWYVRLACWLAKIKEGQRESSNV